CSWSPTYSGWRTVTTVSDRAHSAARPRACLVHRRRGLLPVGRHRDLQVTPRHHHLLFTHAQHAAEADDDLADLAGFRIDQEVLDGAHGLIQLVSDVHADDVARLDEVLRLIGLLRLTRARRRRRLRGRRERYQY